MYMYTCMYAYMYSYSAISTVLYVHTCIHCALIGVAINGVFVLRLLLSIHCDRSVVNLNGTHFLLSDSFPC